MPPDMQPETEDATSAAPTRSLAARIAPWIITGLCFFYLYWRISGAAAREGMGAGEFLIGIFSQVSWTRWLALMVPYSVVFFLVDSVVVWRVVNWFNARVRYQDILPVRASTYILSILNEQLGKGAMAVYLHRREGVPGWQLGSSMLFIMFCEFYYLLFWATAGTLLRWEKVPAVFHVLPWVALGALGVFTVHLLFFKGTLFPNSSLRDRPILHAFREAGVSRYLIVMLLRSPALLVGVVVYTLVLGLFGVEVSFGDMLGYLPVVFFGAAVPGPFRAVAISMWVSLFPENAGQMAAFGLVQHNFFIFFNAAIGLIFMRRVNRELFGSVAEADSPAT